MRRTAVGAAGCSEMGETESCSWTTLCVWIDAFVRCRMRRTWLGTKEMGNVGVGGGWLWMNWGVWRL